MREILSFSEIKERFDSEWVLIGDPETAKKYESLKLRFTNEFQYDRVTYTKSKTEFIQRITQMAKEYYGKS